MGYILYNETCYYCGAKTSLYGLIQKDLNGKTRQRTRLVVTSCEKTGRFIQFTERSPLGPILCSVFVRFSCH